MPPGFFGPDVGRMTDVMLPFAAEPLIRGPESRLAAKGSWWLQIMVRLKPGQSLEQANAALRVLQAQITEGASRQLQPFTLVAAATGNSSLRRRFETPLLAMVVAVGLVLLVACANIASLMLARTLARRREFSVRLALGSSRWRIARLLFIESLIVAFTGAAVGSGVRVVEQCAPRAAVEHMAEHGVAGSRARLARARLHRGAGVSLRAHRWRGARRSG